MKKELYFNKKQQGFTLIETIIAILILTMTIGALLTLAAGGFFTVRYARNQIVADTLLQESLEYVRNTRDTVFTSGGSWDQWRLGLNVDTNGSVQSGTLNRGCFSTDGCIVDPYTTTAKVKACSGQCPGIIFYPNQGFYGYSTTYPFTGGGTPYETTFVRTITATTSPYDDNQVTITATIRWLNGTSPKTATQSVVIGNWRP